eukprot:TRINITY_DN1761_c0_g1_i1.p1 TRINITY_DN1761_c0_g1~~TRINITY_DN1761_c0_g1_i1.p1  ORF type:complete len:245 (+),score=74.54 TRINITY_DN1761_c0_g1_i1:39-773(+)
MGYGLFASRDLPPNTVIGEYTGVLTHNSENSDYEWEYPGSYVIGGENVSLGIDSRLRGNAMRFVNDRSDTNLIYMFVPYKNQWHIFYVTTKHVRQDEQFFISYGSAYWAARSKDDVTAPADEAYYSNDYYVQDYQQQTNNDQATDYPSVSSDDFSDDFSDDYLNDDVNDYDYSDDYLTGFDELDLDLDLSFLDQDYDDQYDADQDYFDDYNNEESLLSDNNEETSLSDDNEESLSDNQVASKQK